MAARWRLAAVAALLTLATACGSGGNNGDKVASLGDGNKDTAQNTNDGKSDEEKFRDFSKCMKEHGFDMPEPGANGTAQAIELGSEDGKKMEKASESCKHLLPNGGKPKPLTPEELDKQRKQAKCLREHGIDAPDPDPNNPGMSIGGGGNGPPDHDKLEKAFKECGMGEITARGQTVDGGK